MVRHRLRAPWFVVAPEKYPELQSMLRARYPTLHAIEADGKITPTGGFAVAHDGVEVDWYQIKVVLPDEYPNWPPAVWEIGGRIPREPDRHINGDGSLCLAVAEDLWIRSDGDFELSRFLDETVRTFLLRNSLVEAGEQWPHGERAHGASGICEFYGEAIGIAEAADVMRLLGCLRKERIKGHWECPCGSGKIIRDCHFEAILKLHSRIPRSVIGSSMVKLAESLHKA